MECHNCSSQLIPAPTREDKPLYPTSVYAITKQDQEQFCLVVGRTYRIPTVALRYFNVYGPRQALSNPYTGVCAIFSARLLNDQPPVIFEDGEQTRDFVHVSDIVQANLLALETDGADYQVVNIGTGVPTSVRQIAGLSGGRTRQKASRPKLCRAIARVTFAIAWRTSRGRGSGSAMRRESHSKWEFPSC